MAIYKLNAGYNQVTTPPISVSFNLVAASHRLLIAALYTNEGDVQTITYTRFDSIDMHLIGAAASGIQKVWMYYLLESELSGSGNKTFAVSYNTGKMGYTLQLFQGVDEPSGVLDSDTSTGIVSTISDDLTSIERYAVMIQACRNGSASGYSSVGTGQVVDASGPRDGYCVASHEIQGAPGNETLSTTFDAGGGCVSISAAFAAYRRANIIGQY